MGTQPLPTKGGGATLQLPAHFYCGQTAGCNATWYGGRPQTRRLWVRWGPRPPPKREAEAGGTVPQFSAHGYCGRTAGWIKMPLGMEVGLRPGDFGLDGDPDPLPKVRRRPGQSPPIFGPLLLWPNGWMDQDGTWHGSRPWSMSTLCWMGAQLPSLKQGASAHLYCGQAAGCIKTPLGTEVGLGLRDIVFDVDPATPRKRAHPPHLIFVPCLLWPNGWIDEDAAFYGSRPRPRPHCIRRGPSSRERVPAVPLFSAHVYGGHGRPSQLLLSSCEKVV